MRDHFKAVLWTMLTVQAMAAAVAVAAPNVLSTPSVERVSLVEPSASQPNYLVESTNSQNTLLVSAHTRSATADVMNLPAEPIPTPPAFAMGMTVILGSMGYKAFRRLRAV